MKRSLRILYVAHRIPYPPDKGDKIRAFHQLAHLCERHRVELCTLVDDRRDEVHVDAVRRMCAGVDVVRLRPLAARARALTALLRGRAFSPAYFAEPGLRDAVARRLEASDHDAVLLFCSAIGSALPPATGAGLPPLLADYCDLDSAKWGAFARHLRWPVSRLWAAEASALGRWELRLAKRCARVVFATPAEADDFRALRGDADAPAQSGDAPVQVIANGVDAERFAPSGAERAGRPTVVFTGAMDYLPNHQGMGWFLDAVWPRVRAAAPAARMLVIGRRPPRSLRRHQGRDGVEVTGNVPDVVPWLHRAWVGVAPLRIARGVQNKVLEAMAARLPTVISPAAARGLSARDGAETLVADGARDWSDAILRLLSDEELRRRLAGAGAAYVAREHDWDEHGRRWQALLHDVVGEAPVELEDPARRRAGEAA